MRTTILFLLALAVIWLSACTLPEPPSITAVETSGEPSTIPETLPSAEPTTQPAELPPARLEFPIRESSLKYAVPDFLDEEQAATYYRLLSNILLFTGAPDFINNILPVQASDMGERLPMIDIFDPPDFYLYHGTHYLPVYSQFRTMALFRKAYEQMVTPDFFDRLNGTEPLHRSFIEFEGRLYYIDAAGGCDSSYRPEEIPDTFELINRTDEKIRFGITCYYNDNYWLDPDEPPKISSRTGEIVMIKTPEGWRFDSFFTGNAWQIRPNK